MTAADKEKIRAAIAHATGQKIGEIHPEFFLSATKGGVLLLPSKAATDHIMLVGCFAHRDLPPDQPRPVRPQWSWGCN